MNRIATVLVTLSVMLALMLAPGSAFAQSATCQAYNPQLCAVSSGPEGTSSGPEGTSSGVASAGTLPFTGLDTGLLAISGGVLLVAGAIVRTRIRRLG